MLEFKSFGNLETSFVVWVSGTTAALATFDFELIVLVCFKLSVLSGNFYGRSSSVSR